MRVEFDQARNTVWDSNWATHDKSHETGNLIIRPARGLEIGEGGLEDQNRQNFDQDRSICRFWKLAERVGFEPTVEFPLHTLSKRAPSTTRTSLRVFRISSLQASG